MLRKIREFGKRNRIPAVILSLSILAVSLAGCGPGSGHEKERNVSDDRGEEEQSPDAFAMGRYVEKIIDLEDRVGYGNNILRMADGKNVIKDYSN